MNNNIKALKVKDKWHRDFGVLSYDVANDSFHFKYDSDTTGFPFSDIDIRKGREFTQNKIFNVFSLDDSYSKNNFITERLNDIEIIRYKQFVPKKVTIFSRLKMIFSFVYGTNKNIKKVEQSDLVICLVPFTFSIIPAYLLAKKKKAKLWIHVQDFEFDLAFESGIFKKNHLLGFLIKKAVITFEKFLLNKATLISSISFQMLKKVNEKTNSVDTYYFPNWISSDDINPIKSNHHSYF